jgi:hypothetical protein
MPSQDYQMEDTQGNRRKVFCNEATARQLQREGMKLTTITPEPKRIEPKAVPPPASTPAAAAGSILKWTGL